MSQPFWLLAPVRPHGQTYLSKLSPLGEGFGGASQRGQSIRLTPRWECGRLRLQFLSAPPGCLQLMGWLSPQLSWFWSPVRSSVGAKPRKSPAKPTELCPGLSPGGWLGGRPTTRFILYLFNCAVFPAASRSLTVVFRSPWSAHIPALPGESGEESQPGCRCYVPKRFVATAASVGLALRLGSSFIVRFVFTE